MAGGAARAQASKQADKREARAAMGMILRMQRGVYIPRLL